MGTQAHKLGEVLKKGPLSIMGTSLSFTLRVREGVTEKKLGR